MTSPKTNAAPEPSPVDVAGVIASLRARGPCPLCSAGPEAGREVVQAFEPIALVRCGRCAMMFSDKVVPAEAQGRYYADTFGSEFHRRGQQINAAINVRALRRLPPLKQIGSFLDVGTGYGYLLAELGAGRLSERLARGGEGSAGALGVEVSVQEIRFAREELGVEVKPGPLAAAGLAAESFDAAGCFEVIEHVERPVEFVAELARHVRPGGWVVVQTDNFAAEAVRRLGPRFPKWIPHSHISHFTPATLAKCIESVPGGGLKVERCVSYTNWETKLRVLRAGDSPAPPARECFDLGRTLATEMRRGFRWYALRRAMSIAWFNATRRDDPEGAMMFMLARKTGRA